MAVAGVPTHPTFDPPESGTEFIAHCERMRSYHNTMYDVYMSWVEDVTKGLRAAGGNPWLLGVDVRVAARRVVRPVIKAAEEHRNIAKGWVRTKHLFSELFQATPSGRHSGGYRIDVNK